MGLTARGTICWMSKRRPKAPVASATTTILGSPGLDQSMGYINDELHPRLRGKKAAEAFEEMSLNDATIAAALYSIEGFLRRIKWRLKPASDTAKAAAEASFVQQCMNDMDRSWQDFIGDALSMLVYGHSLHEIVYKYRRGLDQTNARFKSKYNDGRLGWRNIDLRAQRSIERWDIDPWTGEIKGCWQQAPNVSGEVYLPMSRCVLFRTRTLKNNPEGRSILRGAYRSWHFKKRLEETEAVGAVRSLVNMPKMELPSRLMNPNATAEEKRVRAQFERMVSLITQDRLAAVVVPAERDEQDKPTGYKFSLVGASGSQIPVDPIIRRLSNAMLMTLASEFLALGMGSTGSFALAAEKSSNFVRALSWYADVLTDSINDVCIRRLMEVNAIPFDLWPTLEHDPIDEVSVAELSLFLSQVQNLVTPTIDTENRLRERVNLPLVSEDEFAEHQAQKAAENAPKPAAEGVAQ